MAKKRDLLADQLRKAIDASGQTRYAISKGAGIDESALAKCYSGRRGFSPAVTAAICDYLGLEIIVRPKRREHKGR